ncbi:MAG: bifunctional DNA-formamidopyrimidine glycosylase/DNA-(apurinic or apyrimidinic site) lyase [Sandarakinorhabdus sp.]|nr:bifunctional DNA-formamidopyrimidine glycosylase/DNA-(apurinic or apyrimidinic site) lyase [Sandarakinorhabdus sp.]
MPELPEVETVMRGLAPVWVGQRFSRVTLNRADLRRPFPDGLGQRLTGAVVTACRRRAKYGLVDTDRGDTMILHLGMSGRMRLDPAEILKHDHVVFETANARRVAFNDARRFGSIDLTDTAALNAHPLLAGLGPEPLAPDFGAGVLAAAFKGRKAPVKGLLLDQRIVAGLGNIYVCEALFRSGIHPARVGGSVAAKRFGLLAAAVVDVLSEAIVAGGSSLRDHAAPDGTLGYFQKSFSVYGQEGAPCAMCTRPIERMVQSGRSSFFCATCQR